MSPRARRVLPATLVLTLALVAAGTTSTAEQIWPRGRASEGEINGINPSIIRPSD